MGRWQALNHEQDIIIRTRLNVEIGSVRISQIKVYKFRAQTRLRIVVEVKARLHQTLGQT